MNYAFFVLETSHARPKQTLKQNAPQKATQPAAIVWFALRLHLHKERRQFTAAQKQKSNPAKYFSLLRWKPVDKPDYVMWSRKYDKAFGWQAQRERELGAKFRKNKALTCKDLAAVVEWKFKDDEEKKQRALELVARNDEEKVQRITSQSLSLPNADDAYRVNCLTTLEGVSPVIASVILAFFDPKNYGVFEQSVWKGLLGNAPPGLFTPQNYVRLLNSLRKTAAKHNLDARVIDKALQKKSLDGA